MGTLDEIKRMYQEGMSEQEIANSLKDRGLSDREISNAIAQARIKEAVSNEPRVPSPTEGETDSGEETIPSIMNQPKQFQAQELPQEQGQEPDLFTEPSSVSSPEQMQEQAQAQSQAPSEEAQAYYPAPSGYSNQGNQGYSYSPQASMSSDTISEIAEQVVAEKFYPIAKELEKVIDMRNTINSKLSYLEERLKRIESIIDKLQMSVLQRMTEYVSDVRDMKTELAETQKSFKSLISAHKK